MTTKTKKKQNILEILRDRMNDLDDRRRETSSEEEKQNLLCNRVGVEIAYELVRDWLAGV